MSRRLLQPNERAPELHEELYGTSYKALLPQAIDDQCGPTFPPPLAEGQVARFACYRRLQSEPFLELVCEAVRVNGKLTWALGDLKTRDRIVVDLFPGHRNTLL